MKQGTEKKQNKGTKKFVNVKIVNTNVALVVDRGRRKAQARRRE